MSRRRNNPAGFTLIEVVVAITLMSLIMMTLAMGLRVAANAWHRGEQKLDESARLLAGMDAMRAQVSAAAIRVVSEVGADNVPLRVVGFYGSPTELRFCTRQSWRGEQWRPQYMADYRVMNDAQGKQQLVISEGGLTDDSSVVEALQSRAADGGEAVGDPADRIQMAYYQPATVTQPAQWVSNWKPQDGAELPLAVQVRWVRGNEVQQVIFPVAINHIVRVR